MLDGRQPIDLGDVCKMGLSICHIFSRNVESWYLIVNSL